MLLGELLLPRLTLRALLKLLLRDLILNVLLIQTRLILLLLVLLLDRVRFTTVLVLTQTTKQSCLSQSSLRLRRVETEILTTQESTGTLQGILDVEPVLKRIL